MRPEVRKLRLAAEKALADGDLSKAVTRFTELERAEPNDPEPPRRIAEICEKLGKKGRDERIRAYARAADKYSVAGDVLKAIAMCKALLEIEPSHYQTQHRLAALYAERARQSAPGRKGPSSPPVTPPPQAITPPRPSAPIELMELHRAVPAASESASWAVQGSSAEVHELVLGTGPRPPPRSESRARAMRRAQTVLPFSPIFSTLSENGMLRLINNMRLIGLPAGAALFRQGDAGETMYVVAEGSVAIIAEANPRIELARLGEGAFFGEIALLTNQPRSATVEAVVPTQLLEIDRATVNALITSEPGVLQALLRFVSQRVLDMVFQTNPAFRSIAPQARASWASRFRFLEVAPNTTLFQEGACPAALLVLISGSIAFASSRAPAPQRISTTGAVLGGDLSISPANAWAESKCLILALPRSELIREG